MSNVREPLRQNALDAYRFMSLCITSVAFEKFQELDKVQNSPFLFHIL